MSEPDRYWTWVRRGQRFRVLRNGGADALLVPVNEVDWIHPGMKLLRMSWEARKRAGPDTSKPDPGRKEKT